MTQERYPTFSSLLRHQREVARLTQQELADRAGVGVRTISNLERGESKAPRPGTLRRLAEALELSEDAAEDLASSARSPTEQHPLEEHRERRTPAEGDFLGASPTARLVARGEELERLHEALEEAEGGSGRMVLLAGEPGIGKTRLAQELSVRARERGFVVASGRCYEAQSGMPFYPFLDALSALYEQIPSGGREAIPERLPYLRMLLPDHFPLGPVLPSYEAGQQAQRLLRSATNFLREVASERPVALMLDDLHWADGASVELLAHLARHTGVDRVLLLGTYRDAEVGVQHPLRRAAGELGRERLLEKVDLGRLGREQTAALMGERLGEEVPGKLAGLIYRHTQGNPFFTVEVIKDLLERGDLARREGRWVHLGFEDLAVPESVSEAISQRASRLRASTQETLEGASVLGQTFDFEDLSALVGREDEELEGALEEAVASGLARTEMDRYSFDHALTQQALYAGLSPARRQRLHRSAGEALERHTERVRRRRASEIVHHFVEGRAPARALPYALLAGDAAGEVFAYAEAEHHYRNALELAEEVENRSLVARALRSLGEALASASRYDEALDALEDAADLATELGDAEGEMWAVAQIGWTHYWMGNAEERVVARLWELAGQEGPEDAPVPPGVSLHTLNFLRSALAMLLATASDNQRSIEVARRTLALARKFDDGRMLAQAEVIRGNSLFFLRRPAEALEVLESALPPAEELVSSAGLEEAMPFAERANFVRNLEDGMLACDMLYTARGELDRSLGWAERGLALARRLDNQEMIASRMGRVGLNLFYRGEWKEARVHYERGAKTMRSLGPTFFSYALPGLLGWLCTAEGSWGEAERLLKESTAKAEQLTWPTPMYNAQIFWAHLDLAKECPQVALARLEPLANAPDPHWNYASWLLTMLAQAHLELGDAARAMEIVERALREARAIDHRLNAARALRVKGTAQSQLGYGDRAARTLEEALAMVRPMPHPYEEAQILQEHGMLHVRAREPEKARERLSAALEIFLRLGASKDTERVGRTLREIGRA